MLALNWRQSVQSVLRARPVFDRRASIIWSLITAGLLLQLGLFYLLGFAARDPEPYRSMVIGVPLIWLAAKLRGAGFDKAAALIDTLMFLRIAGVAFFLLQFPVIALGAPPVDSELLRADAMLAFDWTGFSRLFAHPLVNETLNGAYATFRLQAVLVLIFLCCTDQTTRAWQMMTAGMGCLLLVVLLLAVFAADGSFVGCGLRPEGIPYREGACRYGPIIHGVQDGTLRTIEASMYVGLGSFPSFHTAGALIYVWAVWHSPLARWVSLLVNIGLVIGSIVIGGHYFVDIIGGLAVGWAAIVFVKRLIPDKANVLHSDESELRVGIRLRLPTT